MPESVDYFMGLSKLLPGVGWSCGVTYDSIKMPAGVEKPSEEAIAAAWKANLAEPRPRQWPTAEFFARLTLGEQIAMIASDDVQMRVLRYTLSLHPTVESNDARLLAGLDYAVSLGLLTEARKQEILG